VLLFFAKALFGALVLGATLLKVIYGQILVILIFFILKGEKASSIHCLGGW
jgi:hypothetical protein